ncbi:MAG: type II toxin-antitoxin system RelE/ParE family toxin [bacterium]
MVDKIQKALNKFTRKNKDQIQNILINLKKGENKNYDIKKLKGYNDIFRLRKGKIRIIYRILEKNKIQLITIEKRSDTTYSS